MKKVLKQIKDLLETNKVIPEEEKVASPVFITFDQGGWCECSNCGTTLHNIGDHCPGCGYKLVVSPGPHCDIGDSWGGSDY